MGTTARYFSTPTPGAANNQSSFAKVADTTFDHDHGFYNAPFDLVIESDTPGATIRYTLDDSTPTATNGLIYSGPIAISSTNRRNAAWVCSHRH